MELKRRNVKSNSAGRVLLIVPYGIETSKKWSEVIIKILLIVPYGIETQWKNARVVATFSF